MLSTRPLKMVNPGAPELDELRVGRGQTTETPIHTVTAAANAMVAKLWVERRAPASSRRFAVGRECDLA